MIKWKTRGAPAHGLALPFPWIYPDSCRTDPACPLVAQVGVLSPQAVLMSHTGVDTIPFSPLSETSGVTGRGWSPSMESTAHLGGMLRVWAGVDEG